MVIKRILLLICTVFATTLLSAQVTVRLQAPQQCEVGQRIRVSYVVNTQEVEDIQVGEFPGFEVVFGPSTSSQSSFSMVNGKTTQSSSMTFSYTLMARKEGTFKIPAATIKSGGKSYKSGTASIQILPSSGNTQQQQSQQQTQQGGGGHSSRSQASQTGTVGKDDLFIAVSANKQKIFEQEAVVLTYKLYTLVNIRQLAGEMPELDGFHCQEIDSKAQMSLKYERYNGRNYGTAVWRQYVLFPQKSGKLTVPSINFDAEVEIQNMSADPFDIFFGGGSLSQMVKKTIKTPSIDIDVKPLPTPKPANFSGAVGKYTLTGSLTPEQLDANDAATLRLIVSGQGNMKLMKAPHVDFPKDFEVYDPKENNKTTNTLTGAKGNVIFDYVIVPRHGGKYGISPVEFVYFDPDAARYVTLKTDSFHIAVAKGRGTHQSRVTDKEDLKVIASDIHYIKTGEANIVQNEDSFFGSTRYLLYYLAAIIAFLTVFAIFYRQARENANLAKLRGKRAGKAASKRLKTAHRLLKSHDTNAFYDETMRALLGYAADKLNLPVAELNKDNVREAMENRGVAQQLIENFMSALGECEFARFAPGDPDATMEKIFTEASDAINDIDKAL